MSGYRGRGGGYRGGYKGGGGGIPPSLSQQYRPVFDLALAEPMFPRTKELDDAPLQQAILRRNQELSPAPTEQAAVLSLVTKVNNAVEQLMVAPDKFTAASIEEVRQVGSYKKGTMMAKSNVADLVVVLKTLPTIEAVQALGKKVVEEIKAIEPREALGCVPRDFGCEIAGTTAVVRLLVTTIPPNVGKLEPDLHLPELHVRNHLAAVRHARWFEENVSHSSVKVLVRVLKDLRNRHAGMKPLNTWMLELLGHYAVMNTPSRQPLPLAQAFRRCFQLLAAGIYLPSCAGLNDPTQANVRVHQHLTAEEADQLCSTAQTLLRVLCHGGHKPLLGGDGAQPNATIATDMSIWEGVVVTPLERAYDAKEMEPLEKTVEVDEGGPGAGGDINMSSEG